MTARRGKKWRHVYPYRCKGCGKDRIAFKHDRAIMELCRNCQILIPDKDQTPLFS